MGVLSLIVSPPAQCISPRKSMSCPTKKTVGQEVRDNYPSNKLSLVATKETLIVLQNQTVLNVFTFPLQA